MILLGVFAVDAAGFKAVEGGDFAVIGGFDGSFTIAGGAYDYSDGVIIVIESAALQRG